MKKLMIISLLLFTAIPYTNVQAQSISGLQKKVERLEKKVNDQEQKVEAQKAKVTAAEKAVQEEIDRGKEAAKENPKAHSTNEQLAKSRDQVAKEKEQLEKEEKQLKKDKADLDNARKRLEEKLQKAIEDLLKKYPVPDNKDELDDYEKKMKELKTEPHNAETEAELRKRMQQRIDAKRKELEEHGALPDQQNQGSDFSYHNKGELVYQNPADGPYWTAGGSYSKWFSGGEKFPDTYFNDLNQEIYSNAELFKKLMENLGGEFFIGSLSAPGSFMNYRSLQPNFFGINGEYWLHQNFAIEAGLATGHSASYAEFPVTVFQPEEGSPATATGSVESELQFFATVLQGKFSFGNGCLRPVLGVGANFQRQAESTVEAVLGKQRFVIRTIEATNNITAFAEAGFRMELQIPITLEATLQSRQSAGATLFGATVSLQYRFSK